MIHCIAQGIQPIFYNFKWSIIYKNFESLCCTSETNIYCKSTIPEFKKAQTRTSLAVQWLRLCTSIAVGMSSIHGRGTKILRAVQHGQKIKSTIHKKTNKFYFIKIKNYSQVKDSVKRMEKQATYCKKIFTNHISNKGLVSRIFKNSQNSTG